MPHHQQLTLPTLPTLLLSLFQIATAQAQALTEIVTMTSTIPASTITLAATVPTPTNQWTSPSQFQFSILNSTNFFRYLHPAGYLQYNTSLAAFAQSYSERCTWRHNPDISALGYGENLAKGYIDPAAAVDAWGNEVDLFDFGDDGYTGFTEETGHFTQLVWRGTRSVGCGWTDCSSTSSSPSSDSEEGGDDTDDESVQGILLVCNYFPAGNIMASSDGGNDEYMFFKQNVVPERSGGADGFNADDAGRGVGGPSGTATESVAGTVTANVGNTLNGMFARSSFGSGLVGGKGWWGSVMVVLGGLVVGVAVL